MHRSVPAVSLRGLVLLVVLVGGAVGCVTRYIPPTADEPHVVVKLRRVYNESPGPHLSETVLINGEYAALERTAEAAVAPHTEVVLVRPGATAWAFTSTFFHYETRQVQESYTAYEQRTSQESYSCGTSQSPRTCTRMVSRSVPVTKYRWVTKPVPVTDDECRRGFSHRAELGHVYLLQLTYQGSGVCQLTCFEQVEGPTGMEQRECLASP
jgi:hypothetical protein